MGNFYAYKRNHPGTQIEIKEPERVICKSSPDDDNPTTFFIGGRVTNQMDSIHKALATLRVKPPFKNVFLYFPGEGHSLIVFGKEGGISNGAFDPKHEYYNRDEFTKDNTLVVRLSPSENDDTLIADLTPGKDYTAMPFPYTLRQVNAYDAGMLYTGSMAPSLRKALTKKPQFTL